MEARATDTDGLALMDLTTGTFVKDEDMHDTHNVIDGCGSSCGMCCHAPSFLPAQSTPLYTGDRQLLVSYRDLFDHVSKGPGSAKYDRMSGHQHHNPEPLTEAALRKCKHWINHMQVG